MAARPVVGLVVHPVTPASGRHPQQRRALRGVAALAIPAVLGFNVAAHAAALDLNVGSHAVAVQFSNSMGAGMGIASASGQYEIGGLYHSGSGNDFSDGYVGIGVAGDAGLRPMKLRAAVGLRGLYLDGHDASGEAVALGGRLDLQIPPVDRLVWSVYGHYAPDAIAFGDVHEYRELGFAVGYQILHVATIYGGYRNVGVDFKNSGVHTVDNGLHGGLEMRF